MAKSDRIHLRATDEQTDLIRRAAEEEHTSVSAFVLEAATEYAARVLADRRRFALEPEAWAEFTRLLDRPPRSIPALRSLMNEKSVLDRPGAELRKRLPRA